MTSEIGVSNKFNKRGKRLLLVGVALPLLLLVAAVAWREIAFARFFRVANRHGVIAYTEWQGPEIPPLERFCAENDLRGFGAVTELYLGAPPSEGTAACMPRTAVFRLNNPGFDNAALAAVVECLPTPDAVKTVQISNCQVDEQGLALLSALPRLESILWIDPKVPEADVEKAAKYLNARVTTVRPESCEIIPQ